MTKQERENRSLKAAQKALMALVMRDGIDCLEYAPQTVHATLVHTPNVIASDAEGIWYTLQAGYAKKLRTTPLQTLLPVLQQDANCKLRRDALEPMLLFYRKCYAKFHALPYEPGFQALCDGGVWDCDVSTSIPLSDVLVGLHSVECLAYNGVFSISVKEKELAHQTFDELLCTKPDASADELIQWFEQKVRTRITDDLCARTVNVFTYYTGLECIGSYCASCGLEIDTFNCFTLRRAPSPLSLSSNVSDVLEEYRGKSLDYIDRSSFYHKLLYHPGVRKADADGALYLLQEGYTQIGKKPMREILHDLDDRSGLSRDAVRNVMSLYIRSYERDSERGMPGKAPLDFGPGIQELADQNNCKNVYGKKRQAERHTMVLDIRGLDGAQYTCKYGFFFVLEEPELAYLYAMDLLSADPNASAEDIVGQFIQGLEVYIQKDLVTYAEHFYADDDSVEDPSADLLNDLDMTVGYYCSMHGFEVVHTFGENDAEWSNDTICWSDSWFDDDDEDDWPDDDDEDEDDWPDDDDDGEDDDWSDDEDELWDEYDELRAALFDIVQRNGMDCLKTPWEVCDKLAHSKRYDVAPALIEYTRDVLDDRYDLMAQRMTAQELGRILMANVCPDPETAAILADIFYELHAQFDYTRM